MLTEPESNQPPPEMASEPGDGRVFEWALRPGIADAVGGGRVRVDAIARWLQDTALADLIDARLAGRGIWVVRRSRIRVEAFPKFGEELRLRTFCTAIGRFAAERRTSIVGESARVEAEALWIWLDAETLRPKRFTPEFLAVYKPRDHGAEPNMRLRHPDPPPECERTSFAFRATDVDVAGHVNNSHYWAPLEEELAVGPKPERLDAELEYREPAQPGEVVVLSSGAGRWISGAEGRLLASIRVSD